MSKRAVDSEPIQDERFAKVHYDPKYTSTKRRKQRLEIDERFQGIYNDKKYKHMQGKVDKYGRPRKSEGDNSDTFRSQNRTEEDKHLQYLTQLTRGEISNDETSSSSDEEFGSASSSDESTSEESDTKQEESVEQDEIPLGEATKRFAILGCDWTRLRAVDLLALCQSFAPPSGTVLDLTIYPSEFGLQKMNEEEMRGPQGLFEKTCLIEDKNVDESEDPMAEASDAEDIASSHVDERGIEEVEEIDPAKLREYELQKLKYYYAIVVCDSVKTAMAIADQCDQIEYETSSNMLDIRFVPDDIVFENTPKESCQRVPETYKPAIFATAVLQQTNIQLTWEDEEADRLEKLTKWNQWKDLEDNDFSAYIASSDTDSSIREDCAGNTKASNQSLKKYRKLLGMSDDEDVADEGDKKNEILAGSDMADKEITFNPDAIEVLKAKQLRDQNAKQTPFEQYTQEKKQTRNQKLHEKRSKQQARAREQKEIIRNAKKVIRSKPMTSSELTETPSSPVTLEDERNFDLKAIRKLEKTKRLRGKLKAQAMQKLQTRPLTGLQEEFQFDEADPRFAALYANETAFAIDPTDPKFRQTEATQNILQKRRDRGKER